MTVVETWCSCFLRTHRGFDMKGIACGYALRPVERQAYRKTVVKSVVKTAIKTNAVVKMIVVKIQKAVTTVVKT